MKKLTLCLAFFCWHSISSAQDTLFTWGLQVSTFPGAQPEEEDIFAASTSTSSLPSAGSTNLIQQNLLHCIEPGFVVSWENSRTFHNLVYNPLSSSITNLNIVIGKHVDYYVFLSYAAQDGTWFTSFGGSKSFEIKGGGEITPYLDLGFENFDRHSWLIEAGIVYTLELGAIKFNKKNKNKKSPRRDYS